MGVTDPERVIDQFVKYFNSRDLESILAELYEEDAVLLPGPGAPTVTGTDEIRPALKGFVDMGGTMSVLGATAMRNGDIALTHSKWRLEVPGGGPMEGTTAEVVRRQSDGSWKYILDNPFGGAALDAAG
jgi:ketosteroid isomerase-like protein